MKFTTCLIFFAYVNAQKSNIEIDSLSTASITLENTLSIREKEIIRLNELLQKQSNTRDTSTEKDNNILALQTKNSNLERKIAQLTEQNNQYTLKISELLQNLTTITSRNKDLEEKLSLEQTRYSSLDKEQEELLIELAKTELENANLKERLSLLNNS